MDGALRFSAVIDSKQTIRRPDCSKESGIVEKRAQGTIGTLVLGIALLQTSRDEQKYCSNIDRYKRVARRDSLRRPTVNAAFLAALVEALHSCSSSRPHVFGLGFGSHVAYPPSL